MFNTKQFHPERIEWIEEDLRPWFSSIQVLRGSDGPTVYLSRVPLNQWMERSLNDFDRVKLMREDGLKVIHMYSGIDRPVTESEMLTELTLMAAGLQVPEVLQVARTVHSLISGRPVDARTPPG